MSLIIKDKIRSLMIGYPTVSDKYNVKGGILSGSSDVKFGELVKYGSVPGYYAAADSSMTAAKTAGILLATNVKLSGIYPDSSEGALTHPGEAFNLLLDGFVAVELDASAVTANILEGAQVYVTAAGKFTTVPTSTTATNFAYRNSVFTGISEVYGSKVVAEIWVK